MKSITMSEKKLWTEEGFDTIEHDIFVDDVQVGKAHLIDNPNIDEKYLENVDIFEEYQNKGYGTQAIRMLAKQYGYIYFAPTDANNKRLYERIAKIEPSHMDHEAIDQGFGIYYLEG